MPVRFRGAVFERAWTGRVQVVGAVEEGFGALSEEGRGGKGVGEGCGEGGRSGRSGMGYFHCGCCFGCVVGQVCIERDGLVMAG